MSALSFNNYITACGFIILATFSCLFRDHPLFSAFSQEYLATEGTLEVGDKSSCTLLQC